MFAKTLNPAQQEDLIEAVCDDGGRVHYLMWSEEDGKDIYYLVPLRTVLIGELTEFIGPNGCDIRMRDIKDTDSTKGLAVHWARASVNTYMRLVLQPYRSNTTQAVLDVVFERSFDRKKLIDDVFTGEIFAILQSVEDRNEGRPIKFDASTPEVVQICVGVARAIDWRDLRIMWNIRKLHTLFAAKGLSDNEIRGIDIEALEKLQDKLKPAKRAKTTANV